MGGRESSKERKEGDMPIGKGNGKKERAEEGRGRRPT